jgi:hypothetical protein
MKCSQLLANMIEVDGVNAQLGICAEPFQVLTPVGGSAQPFLQHALFDVGASAVEVRRRFQVAQLRRIQCRDPPLAVYRGQRLLVGVGEREGDL